jgi:hypothetical protein
MDPCAATVYATGGVTALHVLCTNVATGTSLYVARTDSSAINWSVHVNY